jgi:short-subunit dehydrogenase
LHFYNRVVLVTGAANGMGRALCLKIGREGGHVGMIDRDAANLGTLSAELKEVNATCFPAVADVGDRNQCRTAIKRITAALGPVDILIAAAGTCDIINFDDLQIPTLEDTLRVNFLGVVYAIESVLPEMLQRGDGRIVVLVSLTAFVALPFENAYSASKAAVAAYLQSLRPPLRRRGIQVVSVYPGFVRTALLQRLVERTNGRVPLGSLSAETAAERIVSGIRRNRRVIVFPRRTVWPVYLMRLLPAAIQDQIVTRISAGQNMPY